MEIIQREECQNDDSRATTQLNIRKYLLVDFILVKIIKLQLAFKSSNIETIVLAAARVKAEVLDWYLSQITRLSDLRSLCMALHGCCSLNLYLCPFHKLNRQKSLDQKKITKQKQQLMARYRASKFLYCR